MYVYVYVYVYVYILQECELMSEGLRRMFREGIR